MVKLIDLHQDGSYLRGTTPFLLDWKVIRTYWCKTFSNSNWVYIWDNWLRTLHSFFHGFLCYFIVLRFFSGEPLCYKIRTNAPHRNTFEPPTTILAQGTRLNKTKHSRTIEAARPEGPGSWPESSHGNLAACPRGMERIAVLPPTSAAAFAAVTPGVSAATGSCHRRGG